MPKYRPALPLSSLAALLLLAYAPLASAQTFPTDKFIEAEAIAPKAPWKVETGGQAYGSYLVAYSPIKQDKPGAEAELSYPIKLPRTANYYVWARVRAASTSSDSFHWALGDGSVKVYAPPADDQWHWVQLHIDSKPLTLSAGTANLKLWYREPGLKIDRLLVTALASYNPGLQEAEPNLDNALPPMSGPLPSIFPPSTRPRLFITATDVSKINQLKSEVSNGNNSNRERQALYLAWKRISEEGKYTAETLPALKTGEKQVDYCARVNKLIYSKALLYITKPADNKAQGEQAVKLILAYFDDPVCQWSDPDTQTRPIGEKILLSALVYDWCEPLLDDQLKSRFITHFLEQASRMEIGFPPYKQGAVVGHGSESQLLQDQLSAGIAFYDKMPGIYNIVAGRLFDKYIEPRSYAYAAGIQHQGVSYGVTRYTSDIFASWIYRRMNGVHILPATQQQQLYHWLYMRRPDGQLMRDGDVFHSNYTKPGRYWFSPTPFLLTGSYYGDGYLKGEFQRQMVDYPENTWGDLWMVLLNDPDVASKPPSDLPLTRYLPDPGGWMVARTAWDEDLKVNPPVSPVIATMKLGSTWFANHQHLDAGNFQLYYKGSLVMNSGIYEGVLKGDAHGYGSAHDFNYHKRTVAHNAMLVLDPAETFAGNRINDGGQRFVGNEPADINELLNPNKSYVVAKTLKHQFGPDPIKPDYSYLKGDLTKAYTDKVSGYTRSFVFLNLKNAEHPAALLVLDKIESRDRNFKKAWLLHSIQKPLIQAEKGISTILRTSDRYNGKLVNQTILPKRFTIDEIGGPGREFEVYDPRLNANVNFPNYPKNVESEHTIEAGAYRIEVRPQGFDFRDVFLNVMQVLDADKTELPTETIGDEQSDLIGVKLADRAVLFSMADAPLSGSSSLTLPAIQGELKVLITDLAPGSWSVASADGSFHFDGNTGGEDGTLYFTVKAGGKYTLRQTGTPQ